MNKPYGGKLVKRILTGDKLENAISLSKHIPQITISQEEIKTVKNIARGLYSPVAGFLDKKDFHQVVIGMKLTNGITFPIPLFLTVSKKEANNIKIGQKIALVDNRGIPISLMEISDKYTYNKEKIAKNVFQTTNPDHPGVRYIYKTRDIFIGGEIDLINNDKEPFSDLNLDPEETRSIFALHNWQTIAGFQTRNPIHRGHEYLHRAVMKKIDGLFINPVIGEKKKGDFKDTIIIDSYKKMVTDFYPKNKVLFSILPYQMQYAGPREAVLHAIIRKNFGCTHFIVGRDHAGIGKYYSPFAAQDIFNEINDLGIKIIKMPDVFYCKKCKNMTTIDECKHDEVNHINLSGTYIRSLITSKKSVPSEIIRPEIAEIIKNNSDPFV